MYGKCRYINIITIHGCYGNGKEPANPNDMRVPIPSEKNRNGPGSPFLRTYKRILRDKSPAVFSEPVFVVYV